MSIPTPDPIDPDHKKKKKTKEEEDYENYFQELSLFLKRPSTQSGKKQQLFKSAQDVLEKVSAIVGDNPQKLSATDLKDLSQILKYTKDSLIDCDDSEKTKKHVTELADLGKRVGKKDSKSWKTLEKCLSIFACAAVVVAGILLSFPTHGAGLLLSDIATMGYDAATKKINVDVTSTDQSEKKALSTSMSQFKEQLVHLKKSEEMRDDKLTPPPKGPRQN